MAILGYFDFMISDFTQACFLWLFLLYDLKLHGHSSKCALHFDDCKYFLAIISYNVFNAQCGSDFVKVSLNVTFRCVLLEYTTRVTFLFSIPSKHIIKTLTPHFCSRLA